jgi:hypothetical protein
VWGIDGALLLCDMNRNGDAALQPDGANDYRFYPLSDLEGNTVALIRGDKAPQGTAWNLFQRYAYTPFGERGLFDYDYQPVDAPLFGWDLFFGGMPRDAATGLDYSHAGFYHPGLGLVLNGDGIGHVDEAELYAHVQPTPTDASGYKRPVNHSHVAQQTIELTRFQRWLASTDDYGWVDLVGVPAVSAAIVLTGGLAGGMVGGGLGLNGGDRNGDGGETGTQLVLTKGVDRA